jgi:predicted nucleotide-binding protein (sugar kinase/HSP70/actin superfamily)
MYRAFNQVGRHFTRNPLTIYRAWRSALTASERYTALLETGLLPLDAMKAVAEDKLPGSSPPADGSRVAVIGHPYNIYDPYISMNVIRKLQKQGVTVLTPEVIPEYTIRHRAAALPKKLFWTMGQRMIGAAFHYMHDRRVDGIIHVASFGCGPDSMTGELIERYSRRLGTVPFLNLTLDEHTGEAGVVTRLEAFLDMVRWSGRQHGMGVMV